MWLGLSQVPESLGWGTSIMIAGENRDSLQSTQAFLGASAGQGLGHTAGRPEGRTWPPVVSAWRAWWSGHRDGDSGHHFSLASLGCMSPQSKRGPEQLIIGLPLLQLCAGQSRLLQCGFCSCSFAELPAGFLLCSEQGGAPGTQLRQGPSVVTAHRKQQRVLVVPAMQELPLRMVSPHVDSFLPRCCSCVGTPCPASLVLFMLLQSPTPRPGPSFSMKFSLATSYHPMCSPSPDHSSIYRYLLNK